MARGWESKAIEAQQEEASRRAAPRQPLSDAQRADLEKRRTLLLTRARAVDDLSRATAPQHRRMLEEAIAALDRALNGLPG